MALIASLIRYARNGTRFFLAVGLSATHVMRPAALCSDRAARAGSAGSTGSPRARLPLPAAVTLAPARQEERRPPLVTWPNYDLKADAAMQKRKRRMSTAEARLAVSSSYACSQSLLIASDCF